jgi:signal transduction histidine kinase
MVIESERLALVAGLARSLVLAEDPKALLNQAFARLANPLDLEVYFNYLVDEERGNLFLHAFGGVDPEIAKKIELLAYGEAVCGTVALRRERMVAEEIQESSDPLTDLVRSLGISAYACYPLLGKDSLVGTLSFGTRTRPSFTEDELDVMQTVAEMVGSRLQLALAVDRLEVQAEALRRADEAKDELLAFLSHELKTPLSVIYGSAKLLKRGVEPDDHEELTGAIESESKRLIRVVDQMLLLARLELGDVPELEPVNLVRVAEQVVREILKTSPYRQIEVTATTESPIVVAEPTYVEEIVRNLLSNADKYSPPGEPIAIRIQGDDARGVVEVEDRGPGLPAEELQSIFERFYRAKNGHKSAGGSGLGLTICRRLATVMGGTITASPGWDRGLRMGLSLPLMDDSHGTDDLLDAAPKAVEARSY